MQKNAPRRAGLTRPGERYRGAEGRIGFLLRQAQTAVRAAIGAAVQPLGLTPAQFSLLGVLGHEGELSSAELAKLAMISPQSVGGIVTNLERAGWVARRRADDHGRIIWLALTDSGRRILERAQQRVSVIENELFKDAKPADVQLIRRWLVACALRYAARAARGKDD